MRPEPPEPCIHSVMDESCASCWWGLAIRVQDQNLRLRGLIDQFGDERLARAVAEHDRYWLGGNAPGSSQRLWKEPS